MQLSDLDKVAVQLRRLRSLRAEMSDLIAGGPEWLHSGDH